MQFGKPVNMPPFGGDSYQRGDWVHEKIMGKGTFGSVVLWKNEKTGLLICIKECHSMELSDRQKDQWQKECKIMIRLKHPNVARGLQTPPELESSDPNIPVLALEYCNGGDLRKVLNKPENSCGLPEIVVRAITRDISLAVEYLHGKKIVHRDLKPENIVMKPLSNGKFQYKLIDLGYAKDVSAGSICKSFVGTEQYLAPELVTSASFPGLSYNCNVDYWCLGTTVFECIVGFRPFFHGIPAVQWLSHVSGKRPEQICGILNIENEVVFSETIPSPNYLCRHSQQLFERWLRYMLFYNADQRGGGFTSEGRPVCFQFLEQLLKGRILNIYSVLTNRLLSYPVEQETLSQVMQNIQQETRIPVQEQEIITESGVFLPEDKLAIHCCGELEEETCIFLFPRSLCQLTYQKRSQPELVQFLISQSRGKSIPYDILKRAYSHCGYYVASLNKDYKRLLLAQKAANIHLAYRKSDLDKERKQMNSLLCDLKAKNDFFSESLELDLEKLEHLRSTGIYSDKMVTFWNRTREQVAKYIMLEEDVNHVNTQCEGLDVAILDMHKLQQARSRNENFGAAWEEKILGIYDHFRRLPRGDRNANHDHSEIIRTMTDFITEHTRKVQELYTHIFNVLECKSNVSMLARPTIELTHRLLEAKDRIVTLQKQRQKDIWGLFNEVLKTVNAASPNCVDSSSTSAATTHNAMPPPSTPTNPTIAVNTPPVTATSSLCNSSMIIEKSTEESLNLRLESISSQQRLQQTLSSIQGCMAGPPTVPDWSFLQQEDSMIED